MARIDRKNQKVFASNASNNGQFGSAQLGTKLLTNDVETIQALTAWANGWNDATISGQRLPTLEELQSLQYVMTSQLAYLFQEGIAEWNEDTTYYQKSIVRKTGTYELYGSLTDDNTGNDLSDAGEWVLLVDLANVGGFSVWGGSAAGTANAIELTPSSPLGAYTAGTLYYFLATATNTSGTVTVDVSALGTKAIKKASGTGKVDLAVGDIQSGEVLAIVYDGTDFQIVGGRTYGKAADIATAGTVNLNAATGDYVTLTGTTTVTAITLAEGQQRTVRAAGVFILAHSANLLLKTGADITTEANDTFVLRGEGGGVVRMIDYERASGTALVQPAGSVVGRAYSETTALSTTATAIPFDDTIPQSGEGAEVLTATITPKSATNRIRVTFNGNFGASANINFTIALFVDSGASAIAAIGSEVGSSARMAASVLIHEFEAGTTSAMTLRIRCGPASGTLTINGVSGTRQFGGVCMTSLVVEEIKP